VSLHRRAHRVTPSLGEGLQLSLLGVFALLYLFRLPNRVSGASQTRQHAPHSTSGGRFAGSRLRISHHRAHCFFPLKRVDSSAEDGSER
jgi:hypothetical protein